MSLFDDVQVPFQYIWKNVLCPRPQPVSRWHRLKLIGAGATLYVLYHNLVNAAVATFRQESLARVVEALPGLLAMPIEQAWWLCWLLYIFANFLVVASTAGLCSSLATRLPNPGLFLTGVAFPTVVGRTLASGLGGG